MTKTTSPLLAIVLPCTLLLGACGSDPFAGSSVLPGDGGATGTLPATDTSTGQSTTITETWTSTATETSTTGTGTSTTGTGGSTTGTGTGTVGGTAPATITVTTVTTITTTSLATGVADILVNVAPVRQLDLVFMIDNSPSMGPKQDKLRAQFPNLINALKSPIDGTLPDLRVAIIDSDLGTGGAYPAGVHQIDSPCGPNGDNGNSIWGDQGKFQMRGAANCGVTDPNALWLEYKSGQPVNYTGNITDVFSCLAANLGTLGCGEEHQLAAFEWALLATNMNQDQHVMLRPNAYLGLVFLSDEDDCSAYPNDGMFGNAASLRGETSSLRCATRAHECNGRNLADSPPGYPTNASFETVYSACAARIGDTCDPTKDGNVTADPTSCNPLEDVKTLAKEIKALKPDPDQILVAGIFGQPLTDQPDQGQIKYKIDLVPNPNVADTAHPQIYDLWPICYDPNYFVPSDSETYNAADVGFGATPGLRESAFVDQFGSNGLKYSICETNFSNAMTQIGQVMEKKMEYLCVDYKLVDTDPTNLGVQPDCRVVYRRPVVNADGIVTEQDDVNSLPECPVNSTNGSVSVDCWELVSDSKVCPINGQRIEVLRTAAEIAAGPLPPGTEVHLQCHVCTDSSSAGCSY